MSKRVTVAAQLAGVKENAEPRDDDFMREALTLAEAALGLTTPNPAVGCVIVRGGAIIGRGVTGAGGRPHGETQALAEAGELARGATAYVSLEPCGHQGQTPPCARALIEAGVTRVVVGSRDPYPAVRGRGIAMLRRAGIEVTEGILEAECRRLNQGFFTRVTRGRPLGILKLAATLDGRIAAANGDSQWISSEESRALVHRWRREADAVMAGAGTVIADNPRLTCRMQGGRDPVRVIIDGRLKAPPDATVFTQKSSATTILVTTAANRARAEKLYGGTGVEVLGTAGEGSKIDLNALAREFGSRGWCRVLIEGGAHLAGAAIAAGIVDRMAVFLAPRLLGSGLPAIEGLNAGTMKDALRLANMTTRASGADWLIEADLILGKGSRRKRLPAE
ncbi:MAG TPA: bifunctional diaminohydroxyphosphoribosylaminopyrimidine deaminase/5-amino-6-(5-phosphoribosylamino)uracil reductase RibD [Candidatus Binataceae bacterium]|nr:bifunctional diaminohydroxyphosphoribosylaminopyrimidine deaminase/5-amino-6-(5-phosphoribosylamino)uracil reductase RibD [Candidatus Binataceae bacterium]